MSYETLRYTLDEGVATVTLHRPETLNSLDRTMRTELTHAIGRAPEEGARAFLLTAEGRSFCSGQDLTEARRREMPDLERPLREEYEPMLRALVDCPIPTVTAVNGVAAGAGASLALAADLVLAARSAQFVVAFARIGLTPDVGLTWLLPRLVGVQRAMGMALTTEPVDGAKAADWGLVWKCVDDDALASEAQALARKLAQGPTLALGFAKRTIRASLAAALDEHLKTEAEAQGQAGRSRDFAEGVTAFLEKRAPKFEGR